MAVIQINFRQKIEILICYNIIIKAGMMLYNIG